MPFTGLQGSCGDDPVENPPGNNWDTLQFTSRHVRALEHGQLVAYDNRVRDHSRHVRHF